MSRDTEQARKDARSGAVLWSIANHLDRLWNEARERFLSAVDPGQRAAVATLLREPRQGGQGLRLWVQNLAGGTAALPPRLPAGLIQVYLQDAEVLPLHDCAGCGVAIPVRPGPGPDGAAAPERVYFPACPACGGRTGWYARLAGSLTGRAASDAYSEPVPLSGAS